MPAYSRIQASMLLVVVLPWVPDTARTHLSLSTCSASHCGPGGVRQALIEHVLHQRVATRHRIADDDTVRSRMQVLGK